jgi:hypothetical protein
VPHGSYLELGDGTKVSFSSFDIDAAVWCVCKEAAGALLEEGFTVSAFVAKQFADRYGQEAFLPVDEPLSILLEKLGRDLRTASTQDIVHALESYAFDLPPEFDRSHLNALPSPSPSSDLLSELIKRRAWGDLKDCLIEVASVTAGIAILWTCEVVRRRAEITDGEMRKELELSKPSDSEAVRTWAEQLLERWS